MREKIQRKKVFRVYALFGLSLLLGFVPSFIAAGLCLIFMILALVWAYMLRGETDARNDLLHTHMTHIITTIWMGSALAVIMIMIGATYLIFTVDHAPMMPCLNYLVRNLSPSMSFNEMISVINPCFSNYLSLNLTHLIIGGVITVLPVLIYFGYRYIGGLIRGLKDEVISHPTRWF